MSIMFSDGTEWTRSELDMVNASLLVIGETPLLPGTVASLLPLGTDGEVAFRMVKETMVEVQSRGWYYNTDYDFNLVPDSSGFITMPPNTLRVDFGIGEKNRYAIKNGKIYDYQEQTFKIEGIITCDVVWLVDYTELPPEAYEYISLRAGRKFQQRVIGAQELDALAVRDEADALTNMMRRQLQSQDYNLQNSRVSTRTTNGFLVSGLYGTKGRKNY